jgi:hypothetical protein
MCSTTVSNVLYGYFCLKKSKLKWSGTLEDLKAFVLTEISEEIAENTSWRSPSGGTWQFDSKMLSVTWHSKSENIYFKGEKGDDLTKRVYSYVNQRLGENDQTAMSRTPTETELAMSIESLLASKNEDINDINKTKDISTNEGASEDDMSDIEKNEDISTKEGNPVKVLNRHFEFNDNIIHEAQSSKEETNTSLSTSVNLHKEPMILHRVPHSYTPLGDSNKNYNPEFEIGALKFKLESFAEKVSNKFDDLAIEINNIKESKAYSIVVLENRIDELMNEKLDLCKTNAELCKENTTMKHTIADLNDKVKSAEEEKASLITAIKLLYKEKEGNEDQINVSQVEQIYSDESLGQQHSTRDQVISNISTHNRFSGLNVDEHIDDAELVNALSQETQMPVRTDGKEARKVSSMQDQIEASSKTKSKVINSDNTKQPNQIGRPVKVAIVGDSMIKYVNPSKLRKSIKQNVHVKTFPGAKVSDMHHYVKPTLEQAPEYLVLHVGTNDLKQSSSRQISTSIAKLGQEIQKNAPTTKLIISEVIIRNDDPQISAKVKEVNSKLLQVCKNNKWEHISHKNIVDKHLNPYGVHLNKQGTIALAKNFTDFLKASY